MHGTYLRKLSGFLLMFSIGFTSLKCLLFFFYRLPSSSLCKVFDSISSNIDEVFLINPPANTFLFGEFNVHNKDWLTYSTETDRPGKLCYNFSISLTFLLGSLAVTLTVLIFSIYLFLLTLVVVLN